MQVDAPRRFALERRIDETGTSGTGTVATGIEWPDGTCAMRWSSEYTRSTTIYDSMHDLELIHSHHGLTRVVYLDDGPDWGRHVVTDAQ